MPGAVVLRAHSHRVAHDDTVTTALAQALALILAAIGIAAWVASRFVSPS
jgi:hypothetical protein